MTDHERIGRQNKNRGDNFEILVANRSSVLGLDLMVKRIDRIHRRGISLCDIEFIDFPEYQIDCKFTQGEFSLKEKRQLLRETHMKYTSNGGIAIVVCGEKKDKTRLHMESVLILFYSNSQVLMMCAYDDWLSHLNVIKEYRLNGNTRP